MNDQDKEIDRVLSALGTAEPAPGMEDRILQRINAGCPMIAEAKPKLSWGWALCTVGTLAALLLVAALSHTTRHAGTPQAQAGPIPAPTQVEPRNTAAPSIRPVSNERTRPARVVASAAPAQLAMTEPASRGLADLPSMLAPPEPVTKQERLLSMVAQGRRPDTFAMLNPVVQELVAQQREARFTRVFPPPTPQEIYLAEHASN